jgi:hypothetical protein
MNLDRRAAAFAFALGLALGAALGSWAQRACGRRFLREGRSPERMLERLGRKLDLDPAQRESARRILGSHGRAMEALHRETRARFEGIRRSVRSDLSSILRPAQKAKFDEMTDRWERRHKPPEGPPR